MNRLESTFPPHLCKKIKFVPDSRQPFENGRILNLAVGLTTENKEEKMKIKIQVDEKESRNKNNKKKVKKKWN